MGAEESRSDDYNFTCASVVERSMRMQVRHAGSWSLLQQCSLDQWMLGYAGMHMVIDHIINIHD